MDELQLKAYIQKRAQQIRDGRLNPQQGQNELRYLSERARHLDVNLQSSLLRLAEELRAQTSKMSTRNINAAASNSEELGVKGQTIYAEYESQATGSQVCFADMNGDTIPDTVIASVGYGFNETYTGAFYILFDSAPSNNLLIPSNFSLADINGTNGALIMGNNPGDQTGISLICISNFTNGHDAIIVGSLRSAGDVGKINIISPQDWSMNGGRFNISDLEQVVTITGNPDGSGFGWYLANAGNVDGSGFKALAVGAPFGADSAGQTSLLQGRATWKSGSIANMPGVITYNGENYDDFASIPGGSADLNNDGFADFGIAATHANGGNGTFALIFGKADLFNIAQQVIPLSSLNDGIKGVTLYGYDTMHLGTSLFMPYNSGHRRQRRHQPGNWLLVNGPYGNDFTGVTTVIANQTNWPGEIYLENYPGCIRILGQFPGDDMGMFLTNIRDPYRTGMNSVGLSSPRANKVVIINGELIKECLRDSNCSTIQLNEKNSFSLYSNDPNAEAGRALACCGGNSTISTLAVGASNARGYTGGQAFVVPMGEIPNALPPAPNESGAVIANSSYLNSVAKGLNYLYSSLPNLFRFPVAAASGTEQFTVNANIKTGNDDNTATATESLSNIYRWFSNSLRFPAVGSSSPEVNTQSPALEFEFEIIAMTQPISDNNSTTAFVLPSSISAAEPTASNLTANSCQSSGVPSFSETPIFTGFSEVSPSLSPAPSPRVEVPKAAKSSAPAIFNSLDSALTLAPVVIHLLRSFLSNAAEESPETAEKQRNKTEQDVAKLNIFDKKLSAMLASLSNAETFAKIKAYVVEGLITKRENELVARAEVLKNKSKCLLQETLRFEEQQNASDSEIEQFAVHLNHEQTAFGLQQAALVKDKAALQAVLKDKEKLAALEVKLSNLESTHKTAHAILDTLKDTFEMHFETLAALKNESSISDSSLLQFEGDVTALTDELRFQQNKESFSPAPTEGNAAQSDRLEVEKKRMQRNMDMASAAVLLTGGRLFYSPTTSIAGSLPGRPDCQGKRCMGI